MSIIVSVTLIGCSPTIKRAPLSPDSYRFTVNFRQNQPLKYTFSSRRNIVIDWGRIPGRDKVGKETINKISETLNLTVTYTPVEVNPFGLTKITASCGEAKVTRNGVSMRDSVGVADAAEGFAGKSWTFTVGPAGKIEDRSNMLDVIRQVGQGAFRGDRSRGLIKAPDMMYDFIALQWFLWDSISSIPKPTKGVKAGEIWKSKLFVPAPMILFAARNVNYQLHEVRGDPNEQIAVIDSTYSLLYPSPHDWPVPYTEIFQMSGQFGFLRDYKVLDLQGQGQEIFDMNAGRTNSYTQKYTMNILSSVPLGLGVNPKITIEQTLSMNLVP